MNTNFGGKTIMLNHIHQLSFYLHICAGTLALIVFWLPILAKKGSKNHNQYGNIFVKVMYAVSISGLLMSSIVLIDPLGIRRPGEIFDIEQAYRIAFNHRMFAAFLFMLSLLVLASVKQSVAVLRAKADREQLKTVSNLALLFCLLGSSIVIGYVGIAYKQTLLQVFAVISLLNALENLHYIYKKKPLKRNQWIIHHLRLMIGAGIACYTAFIVFGGSRFITYFFTFSNQIYLWVTPAVVGISISLWYSKKAKQQFRVA